MCLFLLSFYLALVTFQYLQRIVWYILISIYNCYLGKNSYDKNYLAILRSGTGQSSCGGGMNWEIGIDMYTVYTNMYKIDN